MPATVPTVADFRARLPVFATAPADDTIQAAIDDAALRVDAATWPEADYALAIELLAAHNMVMLGQAGTAGSVSTLLENAKSVSLGPLSATLKDSKAESGSGYGSTTYGRMYRDLLRKNFGGMRVFPA